MVDPLLMSTTAASASAKSLEPPRSIFGASDGLGAVLEYAEVVEEKAEVDEGRREIGLNDARSPMYSRGRHVARTLREREEELTRRVAMLEVNLEEDKIYTEGRMRRKKYKKSKKRSRKLGRGRGLRGYF